MASLFLLFKFQISDIGDAEDLRFHHCCLYVVSKGQLYWLSVDDERSCSGYQCKQFLDIKASMIALSDTHDVWTYNKTTCK